MKKRKGLLVARAIYMGAVEKYWLPDFECKLREYCRQFLKSVCRDEALVFL